MYGPKYDDEVDPSQWLPDWLTGKAPVQVQLPHVLPLTVYERTMVLGRRKLELDQGDEPKVVVPNPDTDSLEIARQELQLGVFPAMAVVRYNPDGTMVRVTVKDAHNPVAVPD